MVCLWLLAEDRPRSPHQPVHDHGSARELACGRTGAGAAPTDGIARARARLCQQAAALSRCHLSLLSISHQHHDAALPLPPPSPVQSRVRLSSHAGGPCGDERSADRTTHTTASEFENYIKRNYAYTLLRALRLYRYAQCGIIKKLNGTRVEARREAEGQP